jgi:hypothetical protein
MKTYWFSAGRYWMHNPVISSLGTVAQLVERYSEKVGVGGSIPLSSTKLLFPNSSVVEQTTVNRPVGGSSPSWGAEVNDSSPIILVIRSLPD